MRRVALAIAIVARSDRAGIRPEGRDRGRKYEMDGIIQQRRFRRGLVALHS